MRALRLLLGIGLCVLVVGCCWIERRVGTSTTAEDGSGKVHKRVHGVTFEWAYPEYLPGWSWDERRFGIAVGVEDWRSISPDGSGGPYLSLSPLSELPNALVVWVAITPYRHTRLALDPTKVRLSVPGSSQGAAPICIAQGRKWNGGMQCAPSQSEVRESVLSAYRARFDSAPTRDEPLTAIPVGGELYAY